MTKTEARPKMRPSGGHTWYGARVNHFMSTETEPYILKRIESDIKMKRPADVGL
jgi:hypothetical protein